MRREIFFKTLCLAVAGIFFCETLLQPYPADAQTIPSSSAVLQPLNQSFAPVMIRGMQINPQDGLSMNLIVDSGNNALDEVQFKSESKKLIKYFLTALTVPEKDLWVNLSPYEKDRITSDALAQTAMGEELLAQDYILKQITAALINPEGQSGKEFWNKVYEKAYEVFGVADVPVDSFNKIWIMPQKAEVFAQNDTVLILDSKLKVMLEEDYYAEQQSKLSLRGAVGDEAISEIASQKTLAMTHKEIMREVILPIITEEVNNGQNFAPLRQIFHALILARWYKDNLKESILGQVYADQSKVKGIDQDNAQSLQTIYNQYLDAFRSGAEGLIKEEYDPATQSVAARKYVTGGWNSRMAGVTNSAMLSPRVAAVDFSNVIAGRSVKKVGFKVTVKKGADEAMMTDRDRRMRRAISFGLPLGALVVAFVSACKEADHTARKKASESALKQSQGSKFKNMMAGPNEALTSVKRYYKKTVLEEGNQKLTVFGYAHINSKVVLYLRTVIYNEPQAHFSSPQEIKEFILFLLNENKPTQEAIAFNLNLQEAVKSALPDKGGYLLQESVSMPLDFMKTVRDNYYQPLRDIGLQHAEVIKFLHLVADVSLILPFEEYLDGEQKTQTDGIEDKKLKEEMADKDSEFESRLATLFKQIEQTPQERTAFEEFKRFMDDAASNMRDKRVSESEVELYAAKFKDGVIKDNVRNILKILQYQYDNTMGHGPRNVAIVKNIKRLIKGKNVSPVLLIGDYHRLAIEEMWNDSQYDKAMMAKKKKGRVTSKVSSNFASKKGKNITRRSFNKKLAYSVGGVSALAVFYAFFGKRLFSGQISKNNQRDLEVAGWVFKLPENRSVRIGDIVFLRNAENKFDDRQLVSPSGRVFNPIGHEHTNRDLSGDLKHMILGAKNSQGDFERKKRLFQFIVKNNGAARPYVMKEWKYLSAKFSEARRRQKKVAVGLESGGLKGLKDIQNVKTYLETFKNELGLNDEDVLFLTILASDMAFAVHLFLDIPITPMEDPNVDAIIAKLEKTLAQETKATKILVKVGLVGAAEYQAIRKAPQERRHLSDLEKENLLNSSKDQASREQVEKLLTAYENYVTNLVAGVDGIRTTGPVNAAWILLESGEYDLIIMPVGIGHVAYYEEAWIKKGGVSQAMMTVEDKKKVLDFLFSNVVKGWEVFHGQALLPSAPYYIDMSNQEVTRIHDNDQRVIFEINVSPDEVIEYVREVNTGSSQQGREITIGWAKGMVKFVRYLTSGIAYQQHLKKLRNLARREELNDGSQAPEDQAMFADTKGGVDLDTSEMDFKSSGLIDRGMLQNLPKINPNDVIGVTISNVTITPIPSVYRLLGLNEDGSPAPRAPDESLKMEMAGVVRES